MVKKSVSILLVVVLVFSIFTIIPTISAEEIHSPDDTPETGGFTVQFGGSNVSFVGEDTSVPSQEIDGTASAQEIPAEEPIEPSNDEEISNEEDDTDLATTGDGSYTVNGFTYSVSNRQATITSYNDSNIMELIIPEKLGGYKVTGISSYVFRNYYSLTTVDVPDSVITIGENAFDNTPWYNNQPDGLVYAGRVAYKYKGAMPNNTVVTLNDNTASVSPSAFENCDKLKEVVFNDGIEAIGSSAFKNCTLLEKAIIPDSVTSIGDYAFSGDVTIEELRLGSGIVSIGSYAFQNCTSLTEVTVPKSVVSAPYAFSGCENLEKITFEDGSIVVPSYIAYCLPYLFDVTVPNSVTSIGQYAFAGCSSLKQLVLPNNLDTLGDRAFENSGLTEITIPKALKTAVGNTQWDDPYGPFYNCKSLRKMTFENGITTIPNFIAANCGGLEEVSIPDSVVNIERYAFSDNTLLQNVSLPNSLESLDPYAFRNCTGITEITIPKSLTVVNVSSSYYYPTEEAPFIGCSGLKKMIFEAGITAIPQSIAANCTALEDVIVPDSVTSVDSHAFYCASSLKNIVLPDSVTSIGSNAFAGCSSIKQLVLPNNLDTLGERAFQNSGLTEITIPKALKTAVGNTQWNDPYGPFNYCNSLKKIVFEDGIITIPNYIVTNCTNLEEVIIPDSVINIEAYAFAGDQSLKNVSLPKQLEKLSYYSFKNCTGLTKIVIPKTLKTVNSDNDSPFSGCTNLKEMIFEEGITTIPSYIAYCNNLSKVSIPDSVTSIEQCAFCGNVALSRITLPKNLEALGRDAFSGTGLEEVTIPNTLATVDGYTQWDYSYGPFNNCSSLKKIVFEDGISTIPNHIAANCTALTEVSLPDTVTGIENHAFAGCTELEELYLPETVEYISPDAFYHSPKLTVHCCKKSKATVSLIDNDINIVTYEPHEISESAVIDDAKSYYEARNTTGTSFVCSYSIKQSAFKSLSDPYIKIKIPNGAEISYQSLYCDGKICTDFEDYTDDYPHCIYVPVNNREGKITFNLTYDGDCKLVTYATLNYYQKGEERFEVIDIINNDIPVIAVYSEEITSSDTVHVTGMAPASTEVKISVDGSYIKSVNSNKAGSFDADVRLPELTDGKDYMISVSAEYNGEIITNQTKVRYQENAPELISFKMTYKGVTYDLLSNTNYSISFVPGDTYPFHFEVKFSNPESIDHVFVTSTRNQSTRSVEAKWNKSKEFFVYTGFFDKENYAYVPGKLSCNFTLKDRVINYDEDLTYDQLPSWVKNATVTKKVETEKRVDALIEFGNGIAWGYEVEVYDSFSDFEKGFFGKGSNVSDLAPTGYIEDPFTDFCVKLIEKYGEEALTKAIIKSTDDGGFIALIKNDATGTYEEVFYDPLKKTVTKHVLKYIAGDIIQDLTDLSAEESLAFGGVMVSGGMALYNFGNKSKNIDSIEQDIKNSSMSPAQKERALKDMEAARVGYGGLAALKVAGACLTTAAGFAFGPLGSVVSGLFFGIMFGLAEHEIDKMVNGYRIPSDSDLNFLVDPSGYVYACVESNRIAGAKVTTYWIPYDEEDEDFWDNPEESSARIWEADEYSQLNPLYTDDHGDYAWDVPEGWWKVVVEKDGYETYTTEWLPVPPPQTEVNIGLVSNTVPQITNAEVDGKTVTLTFSEYVDPESLTDITISDIENNIVDFTLTYSEDEKDATGKVYAKEYQLILDENYTVIKNQYLVTVSTAENYSGIVMDETTIEAVKLSNILGDVDGDDNVEIRDVTWIQRNVADIEIPFTISKKTADVDGDGEITVMDATAIQYYLANMKNPYNIGKTVS